MNKGPFLALVFALAGCGKQSADTGTANTNASEKASTASAGASVPATLPSGTKYPQVQAVFDKSCVGCHGANGRPKGGIKLTDYASVIKGGEDGPIVKAADPENSLLAQALRYRGGVKKMPPRGGISESDIQAVEGWIKDGAKNG